jgi:hypothetical protein
MSEVKVTQPGSSLPSNSALTAEPRVAGGFVLRCGAARVFLGPPQQPRVGSAERALRFPDRRAAESLAAEMRQSGLYPLPWTVVPADALESEGAR